MAKQKPEKGKQSKSETDPSTQAHPTLLPGLGGEPWESPREKPASRLDMERMNRAIGKLLAEQDFETVEEANVFLNSFMAGRKMDDIIGAVEQSPEEEAQDLAYRAMEADTMAEMRVLCRQALELDPHCIDALETQAHIDSLTPEEHLSRLRSIVRNAETRFGEAYFADNREHFWGMVETRPYMRARQALVDALDEAGQIDEAISECEGMLELNPNDNQGMRDVLRGFYLEVGNLAGVRRLNKEYDEPMFAVCNWSAVLERWLSGDAKKAGKLAKAGHKQNKHVAAYLSGKKRIPGGMPGYHSIGDINEAIVCAHTLGKAWHTHSDAMAWLRDLKL